ncbi:unnamed protein product [Closterium sp. NIES-54]
MNVARTSMIHAAAPHFLWPFAVQYAAHQINLQPRVSLPETTPTLRWTGKVGDASAFRVRGSRAFVRDTSADKLSSRAVPCIFLDFPPDALGWQFYSPTSCRVLSSQDVTFDNSGPAPSGVSQVDPAEPIEVAVDSGAARGAEPAGAGTGGAKPGGDEPERVESGGAESERVEPWGAKPGGTASWGAEPACAKSGGSPGVPLRREPLSSHRLREWYARRCRHATSAAGAGAAGGVAGAGAARGAAGARAAGGAAGAGAAGAATGAGAAGAAGSGGARTGGTVAAGAGGAAGIGAADTRADSARATGGAAGAGAAGGATGVGAARGTAGAGAAGAAGPGGARTGGTGAAGAGGVAGGGATGTGAAGAVGDVTQDPGAKGTGAVSAVSGGAARPRPYNIPLLQQPASPLPGPSPYSGPTRGLTERREPVSRPASPASRSQLPVRTVRTGRRVSRPRPPPPDSLRATSPTVTRFLATAITDPLFESTAASALVAKLVDFAAACRLDFATSLVAESASASVCPPSVWGECALSTDVLEDRQEEFECFAATVTPLVSMLLAPLGDPDAPDIPTPRSYAEAIEDPYSSQWQAAMDAEMASWKSTGTYVDEVPPPGANIVSGMWIFRVKRPPGSPLVFKARYVARGFS